MNNQNTANSAAKNEGSPPPSIKPGNRRGNFGQALPRTAPIPQTENGSIKPIAQMLFNVPDWRDEDDIVLQAAAADPTIQIPERLRKRQPRIIDQAGMFSLNSRLTAVDTSSVFSSDSLFSGGEKTGAPAESEESYHPDFAPIKDSRHTSVALDRENTKPKVGVTRIPSPKNASLVAGISLLNFLGNLIVLMFPTLCVLLVSGWGPDEVSIIFDSFWLYPVLALTVTTVLVLIDETAQVVAQRLDLSKALAWIIEFVSSALGAGVCLFMFTGSVFGAMLLGLVVSILTSMVSAAVAKLF